jgi:hypothetical protein
MDRLKRVAWDYLVKYTTPLGGTNNISELRVDFWGRRIQLYGSDNPDSLRGQFFDGVIIDEVGDQNPKIWTDIVRPALNRQKRLVSIYWYTQRDTTTLKSCETGLRKKTDGDC